MLIACELIRFDSDHSRVGYIASIGNLLKVSSWSWWLARYNWQLVTATEYGDAMAWFGNSASDLVGYDFSLIWQQNMAEPVSGVGSSIAAGGCITLHGGFDRERDGGPLSKEDVVRPVIVPPIDGGCF